MKIKGGYYIKARCIQESEIARMPPCTREVWDWLLKEASHEKYEMYNHVLDRGQCLRSYDDIREGLAWKVGYIKKMYTRNQIKVALNALRRATMVDTVKNTHGLVITILNYNRYQDQSNYARPNGRHTGGHTARHDYIDKQETINTKYIDDKVRIKRSPSTHPTLDDVKNYIRDRKSPIDPEKFFYHYEANGWVQGKGKPVKNWKACIITWEKNEKSSAAFNENDYLKGKQRL